MAKNEKNENSNEAPASENATNATKKQQKAFVVYLKADGSTVNFPSGDAIGMRIEFTNKVVREVNLSDLNASMLVCASLQGLATRAQRSYQAEKDIDKCIEAFDETMADVKNGVWIDVSDKGPRVTLLSQAIVKSLEANGQEVDEARRQSIVEKLKTAEYREKAMANDVVKAHLAQLRLDAAKERAKEARDAVKGDKGKEATAQLSDF